MVIRKILVEWWMNEWIFGILLFGNGVCFVFLFVLLELRGFFGLFRVGVIREGVIAVFWFCLVVIGL